MKYGEVIQFDPIESVIQLRDANRESVAQQLVSTFVVSEEMAHRLITLVIPQLQYEQPMDNKGIIIVGNYGTGKSHLMSVISSIASSDSHLSYLNNESLKAEAKKIAGKFKVIRCEIGAVNMSLRDILISELEEQLENMGVKFIFPDSSSITNHKKSFEDMMSNFNEIYPQQGLMLVVDELLDYLRGRSDQELVHSLSFLREIGEVCKDLRFRFVAGVQEAIFDSRRFGFASDSIKRVKDRFNEVLIARNDVKFVVSERLLKKTPEQQALIRDHLTPFAKFYGNMNEKMDEFVKLFPVHPDYIDTFEKITVIEKREVLRTLSFIMKGRFESEIPEDKPGLIAFDDYWNTIRSNAAYRSIPDVRAVIDCSQVLEDRIENSMTNYKDMALRIISALSVLRLTMTDINVPLGASAEELRDRLCLFEPLVEKLGSDELDKGLLTHIETVLSEINTVVNGQFISLNQDNRQYYLDLKKTEDFEVQIEKRSETLDESLLDRYFYEILKRIMECQDITTYVTGHRIWQYELIWQKRNSARSGYLFFGTPNERATAVPTRDFYLYFIQYFAPDENIGRFINEKKSDEVFFSFTPSDEGKKEFQKKLKNYAAAFELSTTSSGHARNVYERKANDYLRELIHWLQSHITDSISVAYQGETKSLVDWIAGKSIYELSGMSTQKSINFKDLINSVAEYCLSSEFENKSPEYPNFPILITGANREQTAEDAFRAICGKGKTKQTDLILGALEILEGKRIETKNSRYTKYILDKLHSKGQGQVLNRDELIEIDHGLEFISPNEFRLEPEWAVVLIAALVHTGEVVLSIPGEKFDASKMQELGFRELDELIGFRHLELPKEWNFPALNSLFELLELPRGMVKLLVQGKDEPVQELQKSTLKILDRIVETKYSLQDGLYFWGSPLFDDSELERLYSELDSANTFYNSIGKFNAPGKLKNFSVELGKIEDQKNSLQVLEKLNKIQLFIGKINPIVYWLSQAEGMFPAEHDWVSKLKASKQKIMEQLKNLDSSEFENQSGSIAESLKQLKNEYIDSYIAFHSKSRLSVKEDKLKKSLLNDSRVISLSEISEIELLPKQQLIELQDNLSSLKTCFILTKSDLEKVPICPHCEFQPMQESISATNSLSVTQLENEIEKIWVSWPSILIRNLSDSEMKKSIDQLPENNRNLLYAFVETGELPSPMNKNFVNTIRGLFSGLTMVSIYAKEIQEAILLGNGPATPEDVKLRFVEYIDQKTKGKSTGRVLIVMD